MGRMKKRSKSPPALRKGITLIELLGVMAIIAILSLISVGGILAFQARARVTSAATAIDAYRGAFTNACISHPGVINNRITAWTDEKTYTSQQGLKKIVAYMNEYLEEELTLYWNTELKCYASIGNDPWNGHYLLTEYPELVGTVSYFDPTVPGNEGMMALAVWASGNSEELQLNGKVGENTYGMGMLYHAGLVTSFMQGFDKVDTYTDYTLRMQ